MNRRRRHVQTQFFTFAKTEADAFKLLNGEHLWPITLAYETYGELSEARDNAVLVFHALSGSQHAAGFNETVEGVEDLWTNECQVGWWDRFIGPGRTLDTRRYFIICVNYLGSCYGSTGPRSIHPATGRPYGGDFPSVQLEDVVDSQLHLLDHLGIEQLLGVIGGSLGGMLALDLATRHPERVRCVIPIAAGARASTLQKLFNFEQIYAIEEDPHFNRGHYYDDHPPTRGLQLARMIGHKTFISLHVMEDRARSEIIQGENDLKGYKLQHQIESYMLHQSKKFVKRFDANSYLRILHMWQRFNLRDRGGGDLAEAFKPCRDHSFLIFSIDSDVCFYPDEQAELAEALKHLDIKYQYMTVHSDKGHDSFLLEPELYKPNITFLLREVYARIREKHA